jgi:hypothetical protein
MIQTINLNQFRNAFKDMNRENQFSYEGLALLFDALEDAEHGREEPYELDVIGLCCEFVEMTEQEFRGNYSRVDDYDDIEDCISDNTWYCGRTEQNTFVFQQF